MLTLAVLAATTLSGAGLIASSTQEVAQTVYARVAPSVLLVVAQGPDGKVIAQGSGFVIEGSLIVTNAHVVRNGTPAVMTGVATIPCTLVRFDERNDLAVLRPSATMSVPPLRAANPNTPIGTRVFAIGNPQGLERTITEGIYSGPRQMQGATLLQISAAISPGSSGGPVVDSGGLVVGIAVGSIETGQNLNFAVPVDTLIALLAQPESNTARPIAPPPSAPLPAPAPAAPAPARTPPAGGGTTADYLRQFNLVLKERLAIVITDQTRPRWGQLHTRESELLNAAIAAAKSEEDLRAVHRASVANQHDEIALGVAREALRRAGAPKGWHYLAIAEAALGLADVSDDPERAALLKEAKEAVLKALPLDGSASAWLLAGRVHAELGEWPAAKSAFNLARTIRVREEDRIELVRGLWRSHAGLNELSEADKWFQAYEATGAVWDRDWLARANQLSAAGRMKEGAAIFARLAGQRDQYSGEPNYRLWYLAAYAHWVALEDKAALLAAAEAVRAAPDTPEARHVAAMAMVIAAGIQVDAGDLAGASQSASFAVNASPGYSGGYTQLARVHFASKRIDEAEREARRAIQLGGDSDPEAYFVLGNVLGARNDWPASAAAFEHSAKLQPRNAYPAMNAGIAHENAGRPADAIRWYEEALRRNPNMKERDRILADIARLKKPRLS